MIEKEHDTGLPKAQWLLIYKVLVFSIVIVLVWVVSPVVAKDAFEMNFLAILYRIWFTLLFAAGLASLFDMKESLAPTQGKFYRERPRPYAYLMGFLSSIVWAVTALILRETIRAWFQIGLELATLISAIWAILVTIAMSKACLDLNKERQKEPAKL